MPSLAMVLLLVVAACSSRQHFSLPPCKWRVPSCYTLAHPLAHTVVSSRLSECPVIAACKTTCMMFIAHSWSYPHAPTRTHTECMPCKHSNLTRPPAHSHSIKVTEKSKAVYAVRASPTHHLITGAAFVAMPSSYVVLRSTIDLAANVVLFLFVHNWCSGDGGIDGGCPHTADAVWQALVNGFRSPSSGSTLDLVALALARGIVLVTAIAVTLHIRVKPAAPPKAPLATPKRTGSLNADDEDEDSYYSASDDTEVRAAFDTSANTLATTSFTYRQPPPRLLHLSPPLLSPIFHSHHQHRRPQCPPASSITV
jgi:hypothetical protein